MTNNAVKIVAVGDLAFNGAYHRVLARQGSDYPFREVLPYWVDADVRLGNLESPTTSQPRAAPSKFTLRASSLAAESVRAAGFDCLCVANNHMMDFGPAGLIEACSQVANVGIPAVGAGKNEEEACAPAILNVREKRVGILAFCDVVQVSSLYAGQNTVGVARWDANDCLRRVQHLRSQVDWLIVNMHWGVELARLPSPQQRLWARALAEAGADLILGHHPHVLQPVEMIGNTVVAYSLGNFLFSSVFWRGRNHRGEEFSSKYCLHPLTRRTGWLEVSLHKGTSPQFCFQHALLDKNHRVVPDESQRRATEWQVLARRLTSSDYATEFEKEMQRTEERVKWGRYDRTLALHAELKLFHWGLLPWAVAEA